jgi:hypothetical protein
VRAFVEDDLTDNSGEMMRTSQRDMSPVTPRTMERRSSGSEDFRSESLRPCTSPTLRHFGSAYTHGKFSIGGPLAGQIVTRFDLDF